MRKILRRFGQGLLILALLLVLLLGALVVFLGPVVRGGVEKIAPGLLGVPVTVKKVSIDVWHGRVELKNLLVGNPDGFSSDPALTVESLRVSVRMRSLLGRDAIEVREVIIDHPRIAYEVVKGDVNLNALQRKMEGKSAAKKKDEAATADAKPDRMFIVDRFECRNGEVLCRADLTLGQPMAVSLPLLAATDIGRKSGGATLTEVTERMLLEILNGVGTVATRFFSNFVPGKESLGKGAEGVENAVKGATQKIRLPF